MWRGIFTFSFFILAHASALEVAFFIKKNHLGETEVYESTSPYSHVAMKVGDQWLNAHPWRGIELTNELSGMGDIVEILVDPEVAEPSEEFLREVLGKKFFVFADWHDPEVFNCTKLVGKYLALVPEPMVIEPAIWGDRFAEYNGKPGLSPGELYNRLHEHGYQSQSRCLSQLLR